MTLRKRGKFWYGATQRDIPAEITRYSKAAYIAEHFADARCVCGAKAFFLSLDDDEALPPAAARSARRFIPSATAPSTSKTPS